MFYFQKVSLAFIALLLSSSIYAQENWKGLNYKIAYSTYVFNTTPAHFYPRTFETPMPSLSFEASKSLNRFFDVGAYIGGGVFEGMEPLGGGGYGGSFSGALLYGVNGAVHILPLFMEKDKFRFDWYVTTRLGATYAFMDEMDIPKGGNHFDYAFMTGLAFYVTHNFGLYGEYGFGEYSNYRVGISLRY